MQKAILPVVMTFLMSATTVVGQGIAWQGDLKKAHGEAKKSGKLLLLHFYGDNCVWCDRLEAGAFQAPSVGQAIAQKYVPVKIHVGKDPSLAKMFQVKSLPTDVLVTTDGTVLSHGVSPQDPGRYVAMLNTASGPVQPANAASPANVAQNNPAATTPQQQAAPPAATVQPSPAQVAAAQPSAVQPAVSQNTAPSAGAQTNQFALPTQPSVGRNTMPGGAVGQTVGARTDAMTLGAPAEMNVTPVPAKPTSETPPLALEGYCAVTINEGYEWVEGKPEFGVIHLGRLYLFSSEENLSKFVSDPEPYTPVMNGIDVVRFFEERKIVPGKRDYGVKDPVHGRMFFFSDQAARDHFENQFERYTDAAIAVMDKAVREANPAM